jgi:CTP synthase (UTP-ammonia lyase)
LDVSFTWHHTAQLGADGGFTLSSADGIWCVPASPYADPGAALRAVRLAREHLTPFLGTCGGFQHALLEYTQNVLGRNDLAHAEEHPGAAEFLIGPLACPLLETSGVISLAPGSRVAAAYGSSEIVEGYHCSFGLVAGRERLFHGGPLRIAGRDPKGEVRAVELDGHPFFVATLFQPERAALDGRTPPLVRAFVEAAHKWQRSL